MNKNHRDETQCFLEKRFQKKENGFAIMYIFAMCYHKDKQTSKQTL